MSSSEPAGADAVRTIGRYHIGAHLDGDSTDDVYQGFDPLIERPVVIKVFPLGLKDAVAETHIKQIFYAEMQRTGALVHEGIATLFDAGELPGALFMASEFVEGVNLGQKMAGAEAMNVSMRASIVSQMAEALDYARDLGAPHLRLRPTNVLVCADLSVKISGFGVAPVLAALVAATQATDAPSRYDAPERRRGETGDARTDVYGLAQLALDVFLPSDAVAAGAATIEPVSLPAYLAEHGVDPTSWSATFSRALAEDPAHRFDCAGDFKRELLLVLGVGEDEARLAWMLSSAGGSSIPDLEPMHTQTAAEAVAAMFADTQPLAPPDTTRIASTQVPDTTVETMMAVAPLPEPPTSAGADDVTLAHDDLETLLAPSPREGRKS